MTHADRLLRYRASRRSPRDVVGAREDDLDAALWEGAAALREVEAAKGLLAVMHCDGGHHTAKVGFVQACKDAEKVRHDLVREVEGLRADIASANRCIATVVAKSATFAAENATLRARMEAAEREIVSARRMFGAAVLSVGGTLRVTAASIVALPSDAIIERHDESHTGDSVYRVILAHPAPAPARLETGPFKPSPDDWTGVFIRGDNAGGYAQDLIRFISGDNNPMTKARICDLVELLQSCDERKAPAPATCPECRGRGYWIDPRGDEREPCPRGCKVQP